MLSSRPVTLLVAVGAGAVFLAGLLLDGPVGAVLLLAVAAGLAALSAAAWDRVPGRGRPLRLLVVAIVAVLGVSKLL